MSIRLQIRRAALPLVTEFPAPHKWDCWASSNPRSVALLGTTLGLYLIGRISDLGTPALGKPAVVTIRLQASKSSKTIKMEHKGWSVQGEFYGVEFLYKH